MNKNILSSYAVFSKLKDEGKTIYDVIRVFIAAYLQEYKLYKFNLSQIVFGINSFYNFKIPSAVIRKALIKMNGIKNNDDSYSVDFSLLLKIDISQIKISNESINEVLKLLIAYISKKTSKSFSDFEIKDIYNDFFYYLLHSSCSNQNMKYIASFLLENENNDSLIKTINEIKEGAIIYTGITTDLSIDDNNLDNLGFWKKKITIFLDTEILFHFYGFNGDYYKQQANDFFSLVKEINSKNRFVFLKYFTNVKNEIYDFFRAAEDVVSKGVLRENSVAMEAIVKGCKTPSDIIDKRTAFFAFLKNNLIEEDDNSSYYIDENNFKYNIEGAEDIHQYLNFINILRKGKNSGKLIDIGFILITGKSAILKQSWEKYWQEKDIPRASSLDYMTEHFWFILNKGFGSNTKLKSFDVVAKARIVIASLISTNVNEKFKDINNRVDNGELSLDEAAKYVLALREETRLPENVKSNEINYILNLLSEDDISKKIEENAIKENKLKEIERQNIEKDKVIEEKNKELMEVQEKLKKYKEKEKNHKKRNKIFIYIIFFIISIIFVFIYFKYLSKILSKVFINIFSEKGNELVNIIGYLGFCGINIPVLFNLLKKTYLKIKNYISVIYKQKINSRNHKK